ncbi:hypothetical protein GOP47_0017194 [Adiantum capillus-veneris]|uniref:UDP-glycosyltransferases domain-containing protein n=1 Tax=Adiantum capillus-veneris TaxID=13818 RepID=A0A9D4UJV2_ADICA|nr:hypothetical protein GOP47_0017194 [Adiantum capillus-veneris]
MCLDKFSLIIGSEDQLISDIGGVPPLRKKDLPGFIQCNDPSDFMFKDCVAPLERAQEAMCVLFNTFNEMEGEAVEVLRQHEPGCRFYTIGPVLPEEYFFGMKPSRNSLNMAPGFWAEDYDCLQWLDKQEAGSVLYVSFGSITELSEGEVKELALGLEASCVLVLWVLRPGTGDRSGHSALPPGFKERTAGHMMIIEWAPQLHVLAHPAVGAFFTHAGWNSVLEGVVQGKPLLGYPYFDDQMLNCRCIEEQWGNGLALKKHGEELLTHSVVESKVRAVMTDAKIRQNALQLSEDARRAVQSSDPGSSAANFKSFIQALTKAQDVVLFEA